MKLRCLLIVLGIALLEIGATSPPRECNINYNFAALDQATIKSLASQGSLMIVRQRPDLSLINVTAGQVVDAPLEVVWGVINDQTNYPKFMPQTTALKVLSRQGNDVLVEQTLAIKFWQLPSVEIKYQLQHRIEPMSRTRFWWVSGDLQGTYGGWDLVPSGKQTLLFYTLYSNLTSIGWGVGSMMKSQPDFMAGVNVTTTMLASKAIKAESERRAKK